MIKPSGWRLLVEIEEVKEVSDGGIWLPKDVVERERLASMRGTVVSVGDLAWKDRGDGSPWAKVGDKVFFAKYSGTIVLDTDGKEYRLMNDEDVLGVISE